MDNDCLDANCCPSCKEPMNHNSRGWGCNNKDCENRYTFWVGPYFVKFNGKWIKIRYITLMEKIE